MDLLNHRRGKHRSPKRWRFWLWTLAAFLGTTGIALAIYLIVGGFTGSITAETGTFDQRLSAASVTSFQGGTCAIAVDPLTNTVDTKVKGKITLTWTGALPGDKCSITSTWHISAGTVPVVLQEFVTPTGVTATFPVGQCGVLFPTSGANVEVKVDLVYNGPGNVTWLPASGHGFTFVRQGDYVAADCNATTT